MLKMMRNDSFITVTTATGTKFGYIISEHLYAAQTIHLYNAVIPSLVPVQVVKWLVFKLL